MSRPIEATPALSGEDALRLLHEIELGCSEVEMRYRERRDERALHAEWRRPSFEVLCRGFVEGFIDGVSWCP